VGTIVRRVQSTIGGVLGLEDARSPLHPTGDAPKAGIHGLRFPMMTGPAIRMDTIFLQNDRIANKARPLNSLLDTATLLEALEHCECHHGDRCRTEKPLELLGTRMINIVERKVVPCPKDCDYIALSYLWGGVQPAVGALEDKRLPQTIEDAITVTRALHRRYLWVRLTI